MSDIEMPFKGRHDFKDLYFLYFLNQQPFSLKEKIGQSIMKFQGNIRLNLQDNIYIIIENEQVTKTPQFKKDVLMIGKVNFYDINKYYVINCENKEIKEPQLYNCLTLSLFFNCVSQFNKDQQELDILYKHGLSKNFNKECGIALYIQGMENNKSISCDFQENKDKRIKKYDIPQYIEGMPDGFAVVCTLWEAAKVKKYMEQKKNGEIQENKEKDEEILLETEPMPRSEHKYCHLCRKRFKNYIDHIKNDSHHKNSLIKQKPSFNIIKNTFKNIVSFWKEKNNDKSDTNVIDLNSNELSINNNGSHDGKTDNTNSSTKDDSNNERELSETNSQKELKIIQKPNKNEGCQAKKKLLSSNSISTTQSSIHNFNNYKIKRKKNEFEKNINYIQEEDNNDNNNKNKDSFHTLNPVNPRIMIGNKVVYYKHV